MLGLLYWISVNVYNPNHIETPVYFKAGIKVLISDRHGNLLLLRRSDKVSRAHGWDLAGGGIEAGEQPIHAARREIEEETGLKAVNLKLFTAVTIDVGSDDAAIIMGFTALVESTRVRLSWEHEAYAWVRPEDAGSYQLARLHMYMVDVYRGIA